MSPLKHSNHTAARIGRWSAKHWKTAVIGWLVFVIAAGLRREHRRDEVPEDHRRQRRRGPQGRQDHRRRLQAERERAGRGRPDPVEDAHGEGSRLPGGGQRRDVDARAVPEGPELKSPLGPSHSDQISASGRAVMVTFTPKGDYDHAATYIDTIKTQVLKAQARHPGFTVEELGSVSTREEAQHEVRQPDRQGRPARAAAGPDHPAVRLRLRGRGARAAPAGPHRRVRDQRARRDPEPVHPRGQPDLRGDPADRARGRDRLLALLPPA